MPRSHNIATVFLVAGAIVPVVVLTLSSVLLEVFVVLVVVVVVVLVVLVLVVAEGKEVESAEAVPL